MPRLTKKDAERLLANVPEQYVFWAHDGRQLRNNQELCEALQSMSDETYAFHSNDFKKDFGNWVRDIIGDAKLARDLDLAAGRTEAVRAATRRYAFLKSKLTAEA